MRLILSLILSVLLTLASQTEAVARSEMAGASDQIVCGAGGTGQVTLDAAGHVIHRHPCSHCLAAAVAATLPAPAALPVAPLAQGQRLMPGLSAQTVTVRRPTPPARAPPHFLV